jgi:hypothetical protein
MEKNSNRKRKPLDQVAVERINDKKPQDRISAKMIVAQAAGYGPHYGQLMADHPHLFDNWEPGMPLPEIPPRKKEGHEND